MIQCKQYDWASEMTITELFPSTPWRKLPKLKNRLSKTRTLIRRQIKSQIKKVKKVSLTYTRKQYFVLAAYKDIRKSARHNEDIFIASIALLSIVAYSVTVMFARFLVWVLSTTYAFSLSVNNNPALLILLMGAVLAIISLLVVGFSMNFITYALMEGATRKQHRSIRLTVRKSMKSAGRTVLSWFMYGMMIVARTSVLLAAAYTYIKWIAPYNELPLPILAGAVVIGAVWVLAGMIKYSLVPAVALFEPNLIVLETFERSRDLTRKGSRPFLLTGLAIIGALCTALFYATQYIKPWIGSVSTLLFVTGVLSATVWINCALTMLYRKRKYARSL